ncbi:MAG: hypothetical protein HY243_14235 [Proteobacteria bacterium]|nr:hypothetical protein [Pseudomonadota bacterium]
MEPLTNFRAVVLSSIFAALGVFAVTNASADAAGDFAHALISSQRSPEIRADEDIYASLLGAWDVEVRDRKDDGSYRQSRGEWLFARTLEGRAVQDVWISPPRSERRAGMDRFANRYGNSLRTFDPNTRHWQVVWLNPVSGAFNVLAGRRENGQLIQEGTANGQHIRWTFVEIKTSTFHWKGETLLPDGTWRLDAEFNGRRHR